jgi:hypothetical protein
MSASAPAVHSVHIYDEASDLIARLCGIVSSSLQIGDAVLVVATAEHREQLVKALHQSGVDVRVQARAGRYTMVDAEEMLATFMLDGMPDHQLFTTSVGLILARARKAACSKAQGLMVFGEMVAVLWDQGRKEAALELEELWNHALLDQAFHLHCAYPRRGFINQADEVAVCSVHSHVVPPQLSMQ